MGLTALLDAPFYEGTGSASITDLQGFPVALGGRPFQVDWQQARQAYRRFTVQIVRQQADQSDRPSERSINPEGLWRRSFTSWHLGRGQVYADRADSLDPRFEESRRVDVWDRWSVRLLHDTVEVLSSSASNLRVLQTTGYLYAVDGQAVKRTAALAGGATSWTTLTGTPAATCNGVASDGSTVYAAYGASGVYSGAVGAGSMSSYNSVAAGLVDVVKGRVMVANGASLYNVTASGAAPAALYTHPNSSWTWVGFAEGVNQIYAAGYAGEKSLVYRTAIKADGTALDTPVVAGPGLPDGERVLAIHGYLGFVFLGTTHGVRMCQPDANGNLTIGPVLECGSVRCFEGQGRFVWFGVDQIDNATVGLGRLDLTAFVDTLAPAHAYDLEVAGTGDTVSVATFSDQRVFCVAGDGVYAETTSYVTDGWVKTGPTAWGLTEPKVAVAVDVAHDSPSDGSIDVFMAVESQNFTLVGSALPTQGPIATQERRGVDFNLQIVLTAGATESPVVKALTLRANPAVAATEKIRVPLLLASRIVGDGGGILERDPSDDRAFIVALRQSGDVTTWTEEASSTRVMVEDFVWVPERVNELGTFDGSIVVEMKVIEA
jgi:hypothetical protein